MNTPAATFGFRAVSRVMDLMARMLGWKWTTAGVQHVPRSGGAVITWNHHSHIDFMATACEVYFRAGRPVRILVQTDLWDYALLRMVLRLVNAVPVDRTAPDARAAAFEAAVQALKDGHLVLVAPEGRISRSLELLPFRSGAVRMAQAAGVAVVPSAAWGTHRVLTPGRPLSLRAALGLPVSSVFGPPMDVSKDGVEEATSRLQAVTAKLLDEVIAGYPAGTPSQAPWVPRRFGGGAPPPGDDIYPTGSGGSKAVGNDS